MYESVKKIGDKILGMEPMPESEMDEYQKLEKQALDLWKKCFAEARVNRGKTEAEELSDADTQYSLEQRAIINAYKNSTDIELKQTFEEYFDGSDKEFTRYTISPVSQRQADDAERILGKKYVGYKNSINGNGIQHIIIRHGPNGKSDHSLADFNDAARMAYVLDHYDNVELLKDENGEADVSKEFMTADNTPAPKLKYAK
ncbi:MAG: hypothetical protein IKD89_07450 [Clostridia bacterium]|nr:hypothetical protein [Clostridia bacterium]